MALGEEKLRDLHLWTMLGLGVSGAYLLGSVPCAILVSRLCKLPDPRSQGSGNPGATNVLRVGGRFPALITLLGDVLKGFVPVMLIKLATPNPWVISAVMLAAVLGHLFPIFLKFQGGKGVATALGALWGLTPLLGGIFVLVWLGVFVLFRISSISSLLAIVSMPFAAYWLLDKRYGVVLSVLALLIIWRHRSNIYRLWKGKESSVR